MPKSVITIDVDDARYKAFVASFQKFQEALATAKTASKKLSDASGDSSGKSAKELDKVRKQLRDINKEARDGALAFRDMATGAASVASSVASTTLNLAKWVSFGLIGSGFGLGLLAAGQGNARRESLGYGITTGELRAAKNNLQQFVGVDSALSKIAAAQYDPSMKSAFLAFGVNPNGKDAATVLTELIASAKQTFDKFKGNPFTLAGTKATELLPFEEMLRLANSNQRQIATALAQYAQDRRRLDVSGSTGDDWQTFIARMKGAGDLLENTFGRALIRIAPQLESLADQIGGLVTRFVEGGTAARWIKTLGEAAENAADYLGSDEFSQKFEHFTTALDRMTTGIIRTVAIFEAIGNLLEKLPIYRLIRGEAKAIENLLIGPEPERPNPIKPGEGSIPGEGRRGTIQRATGGSGKAKYLSDLSKQYGLPAALVDAIWNQESGRGAHAGLSATGDLGEFQFSRRTAAQYGLNTDADRMDFYKEGKAAVQYLADLSRRFDGNLQKVIAGYNSNPNNIDPRDPNWKAKLPDSTRNSYLPGVLGTIQMNVTLAPGLNADASAAATYTPGG